MRGRWRVGRRCWRSTGFQYSGVDHTLRFARHDGSYFWATGDAWGTCLQESASADTVKVSLTVMHGTLALRSFALDGFGSQEFDGIETTAEGSGLSFAVRSS